MPRGMPYRVHGSIEGDDGEARLQREQAAFYKALRHFQKPRMPGCLGLLMFVGTGALAGGLAGLHFPKEGSGDLAGGLEVVLHIVVGASLGAVVAAAVFFWTRRSRT